MTDDYDEHSEYQRRVVASGASLVARAVQELTLPDPPEPLVIADLGAGTGGNSMAALGEAVAAARARRDDLDIVCVHADLPTNDWNALFATLDSSPDSYRNAPGPAVLPMAAARSFFEPVMPHGRAHLQMSFSADRWLRSAPTVDASDGFYFSEATGQARRDLDHPRGRDWAAFLQARARDLAPGGWLIVQCVGTEIDADGGQRVTARELLAAMTEVARGMADDCALPHDAVRSYIFPPTQHHAPRGDRPPRRRVLPPPRTALRGRTRA